MAAIERSDLSEVTRILSAKSMAHAKIKSLLVSEVSRSDNPDHVDVPLMVASRIECPAIFKYLVENCNADVNFVQEYVVQVCFQRKRAESLT
jgi:hypothetical protein